MSDTSPAVYVENLRKVYGSKVAVDSLSLQVERGEVFGFLGPNGAGKTTTIKMLNGLVRPTSGRLSLLGRPLHDREMRRRVGFLPEQFRFHEWLRAEEFLDFHGTLYGLPKVERRRRIPEALELVGLEGRAKSRLRTFSKGMLQRIGIAQAVLADPLLVFLDEPTSALDPLGRRDVRDIINTLRARGVTVFLNSHLLGEVESVCDRVAIIRDGKVAAMGSMNELLGGEYLVDVRLSGVSPEVLGEVGRRYRLPGQEVVRTHAQARTHQASPVAAGTAALPRHQITETFLTPQPPGECRLTVSLPEDEVPALVDLLVREGARLHELVPRQRSLEDLFVDIIRVGGDR